MAAVRGTEVRQRQTRVGGVEPPGVGEAAEAQAGAPVRGAGPAGGRPAGGPGRAPPRRRAWSAGPAQSVIGSERTVECCFCGYGPSRHLDTLHAHGMRFSGHDEDGSRPHPMIRAPARAAVEHAARAGSQPV